MKKLVVLVSGGGTNLQRIIDVTETGEITAAVSLVVADRECFGLKRAEMHNIPTRIISRGKDFSDELLKIIPPDTDLIVLAGFLSILNENFCRTYEGRIINIHPALLPKFGGPGMWGAHVHQAVLNANEKESGVTVHFVNAGIDEGEVILQKSFPVAADETLESLSEKIHKAEHDILPNAINKVLNSPPKSNY